MNIGSCILPFIRLFAIITILSITVMIDLKSKEQSNIFLYVKLVLSLIVDQNFDTSQKNDIFFVYKRPTIFEQSFLRVDWNVSFPKGNPISAQFWTIGNKTRTRLWFANDWIQIMDILLKWQNGSSLFVLFAAEFFLSFLEYSLACYEYGNSWLKILLL